MNTPRGVFMQGGMFQQGVFKHTTWEKIPNDMKYKSAIPIKDRESLPLKLNQGSMFGQKNLKAYP